MMGIKWWWGKREAINIDSVPALSKASTIPAGGLLTKNGVLPVAMNFDSYTTMMERASGMTKGAAGMGSPTANRMKARIAEGMVPLAAAMAAETSGIGWRVITEPVQAAMLNGFEIITDNPDDKKRIRDFFDDNRFWDAVEKAVILKRHQGWSVMVLGDSWLRSHGGHFITPSTNWFTDYNDPHFGLPEGWTIQLRSPVGDDVFVEQDDSILFGDKDYQPIIDTAEVSFGEPLLCKPYASLQRLGLSHELILSILSLSVIDIYKKVGLHEDLDGGEGERKLIQRFSGMVATRQLNDMIGIDAEEDLTRLQSSMTGVADIMDVAIKIVCADTGFPASRLTDRQGGLSNNDQSAGDQWESLVGCIITKEVIPVLKYLARHYLGIRADFVPNKSQGQIDREVDRDYKVAQTAQLYYEMRGITSEEARETARRTGAVELLSEKAPATGVIDDNGDNENDNQKPDDTGNADE